MRRFVANAMRIALFGSLLLSARATFAQTADDVAAARRMFAEAFQDEEHARYEVALEKFRRVQAIKDTATVRLRIGTCLDALGRLEEAVVEYDAAVARADASQRDISSAASQRAASARLRMPEITVDLSEQHTDAVVLLDKQTLSRPRMGVPQRVNPGRHIIDADAPGQPHFHAELDLREASSAHVRVFFDAAPKPPVEPATKEPSSRSSDGSSLRDVRTAGWITLFSSAAVLGAGVVVLVVRHGEITSIQERCPASVCPSSERDSVLGAQSTARTLGPIGVTLVVAGSVGALVGAGLLSMFSDGLVKSSYVSPTRGGLEAGWIGHF